MKKHLSVMAVACAALLCASAASFGAVLTLEDAVERALRTNPELAAARFDTQAEAARKEQAGRWPDPELTGAVEDYPPGDGSLRDSKTLVGIEQTVPFPGKLKLDRQAASLRARRSESEQMLKRIEITRDVKNAFYRVLAGEEMVRVSRDILQAAESSVEAARKRVEAGAAGDQEALRAEVQLEQVRAVVIAQEEGVASAKAQLAHAVGDPSIRESRCQGRLPEPTAPGEVAVASGLGEAHPSMEAAEKTREQKEIAVRRARLEAYPDVTFGLEGGREGRDNTGLIQFRMSLPLPLFSRPGARVREAQAEALSAEANVESTRLTLWRDLEIARERVRASVRKASAYKENILPKSDEALRLVRIGFQEGRFTLMDLLDTQRAAAEARLGYQGALLDLALARNELEALQQR